MSVFFSIASLRKKSLVRSADLRWSWLMTLIRWPHIQSVGDHPGLTRAWQELGYREDKEYADEFDDVVARGILVCCDSGAASDRLPGGQAGRESDADRART